MDILKNIFGKKKLNPFDRITIPQKKLLKKTSLRGNNSFMRFTDSDRDGVINGLDCAPRNRKKHNMSLYRASNRPPSEDVQQYGKTYGFSNYQDAENWRQRHNLKSVYQVNTRSYDLDPQLQQGKRFMRNGRLNDNEYVFDNVDEEREL